MAHMVQAVLTGGAGSLVALGWAARQSADGVCGAGSAEVREKEALVWCRRTYNYLIE